MARDVLLDADTFRILHGLKPLTPVLSASRADRQIVMTGYVARHALSRLRSEVEHLQTTGILRIEDVRRGTEAGERYRAFQRETDKGEAEAIAWALDRVPEQRPLFVSRDARARQFARQHRVPETDVMGLVVEAVLSGRLSRTEAKEALGVWDDPNQQLGRPKNYSSFEATFEAREQERLVWMDVTAIESPSPSDDTPS